MLKEEGPIITVLTKEELESVGIKDVAPSHDDLSIFLFGKRYSEPLAPKDLE